MIIIIIIIIIIIVVIITIVVVVVVVVLVVVAKTTIKLFYFSACMVLENKFSPYPGMALAGFDEFKIYLTLAECLQACIDEQGFTCLSADYMPETLACHLDSRSHCMAPELFVPVSSMNHYHRECIQD